MDINEIPDIIKEFSKSKKKFPDGRIDYSGEEECAVITVFVMFEGKLLLMKRSDKVGTYKGKWMALAGYYDEPVTFKSKVVEELREEIGVIRYKSMTASPSFIFEDKDIGKKWIIFSAVVELAGKPDIVLDWEHSEFIWIDPSDLHKYDIVPSLEKTFRKVFK